MTPEQQKIVDAVKPVFEAVAPDNRTLATWTLAWTDGGYTQGVVPKYVPPAPTPTPTGKAVTDLKGVWNKSTGNADLTYTGDPAMRPYKLLVGPVDGSLALTATEDNDNTIHFKQPPGTLRRYQVVDAQVNYSNITTVDSGYVPVTPPDPSLPPLDTQRPTSLYGTSGMAPWVYHAHALDLKLPVGADIYNTRYEWEFGDPSGRFNVVHGWSAAHYYASAGSYTVTLTLTFSDGTKRRYQQGVSISAASRSKVKLTTLGPVIAFDNTDVFLPPGVLNLNASTRIKGTNLRVYPDPTVGTTLHWSGGQTYDACLEFDALCNDVHVGNVRFDSRFTGHTREDKPVRGVQLLGTNVAVVDCYFDKLGDGINAEGKPKGVLVLGQICSGNLAGYSNWADGYDYNCYGQVSPDSWVEHTNRIFVTRGNFSHNTISNPGGTANAYKGSLSERETDYLSICDNTTGKGPISIGPLEGTSYRCGPLYVVGNTFGDQVEFWPGVDGCVLASNTINVTGKSCILVRSESATRYVKNVKVLFNAMISDASGPFSGEKNRLTILAGNTFNGKPL